MNISRLAFWLYDLVPSIEVIDGHLFIDRLQRGLEGIKAEAAKYPTMREAQGWINIVPITEFLSEAIGDEWELDDSGMNNLLAVYEKAWTFQIKLLHPGIMFKIERWVEADYG